MVYLQTLTSPEGTSGRCFGLIDRGWVELHVSPTVLLEIGDIFTRPSVRARFPWVTDEEAYALAMRIRDVSAIYLGTPPHALRLPRDPKDEPYLDLAVAVGADFLVTWNYRHLGYLESENKQECLVFRQRFPNLKVRDPVTFLRTIDSLRGSDGSAPSPDPS